METHPSRETENFRWGKLSVYSVEERFLAGPRQRRFELWETIKIFFEFLKGYRSFHFVGPCVTVFGSARFSADSEAYSVARQIGALLARDGFTVMTGGGPGIMEAANRGAKEAGGMSIGCNIVLPTEQQPNAYLDRWVEFKHFFVRKVMLLKYSYAFIAMPGGFGTLDEIFETATLIQTGKIKNFPIVLVGKDYWAPLLSFMRETLLERAAIDSADLEIFQITDSPEEAAKTVREYTFEKFGLSYKYRPRSWKLLWER